MKIITKFNLGDKVTHIRMGMKTTTPECTSCSGTGKIILDDGETTCCPKCHGAGYHVKHDKMEWAPMAALTLGEVRVVVTDSPGIEGEETFDNFKPQKDRKETYMAIETGIGTGNNYNANDLFATREEAQAKCDKRNNLPEAADG